MKPVVRQADFVMAVEAARTAWILSDVDRQRSESPLISRSESPDPEWTYLAGPVLNAGQYQSTTWKKSLCVN